ncbi:alpha/beta hydrolase family protein [Microbulbifer harenosus]|uniref:S9 family peptidase n=1 Tax=Microbulbifer harenosus TaxID=2576840 RepID=A0ABY2UPV5_9GAMM|nr:prolyl oligopeptidase family serine peptidase [Microbulbifer harenosus]TLM79695.1 S9 family peptidase [Microbulbifer harenosus]
MKGFLAALFSVIPLFGWAQGSPLIQSAQVFDGESCWSGNHASYERWRAQVAGKIATRNLPEKKAAKALENFEQFFPVSQYLQYRDRLECETFIYEVDGAAVRGFVIRPKGAEKSLPVVVYNRGGNGDFGAVTFSSMMRNLFPVADRGFVVVGSQYRGTFAAPDSDGPSDEFGGRDIEDVRALFDLVPAIRGADAKRIGMWGHSRGGIQTFMTARSGVPVKALVVAAGVADLSAGLAQRPDMEAVFRKRIPEFDRDRMAALKKRSVLLWAEELDRNLPILLLHGTADEKVSVEQSRVLAQKFQALGHRYSLVEFEGDNHGFNNNREAYLRSVSDWFNRFL